MSSRRLPRRGVVSFSTLCLTVVAISCAALVVRRLTLPSPTGRLMVDAGLVPGTDTAPATAPRAQTAIGATKVRQLDGKLVPLIPRGEPTIVMINSRTCPWCKKALKDLGEMANGHPVPRLTLLTLEGAAEGVPMAEREGLTGVRFVGPTGDADQVFLTFRYTGTPTFVAVDRNGRVVHTIPGYPIRPELLRLYRVMAGDSDAP